MILFTLALIQGIEAEDPALIAAKNTMVESVVRWEDCGVANATSWLHQPETATDLARIALSRCSTEERTARDAIAANMRLRHAATAADGVFEGSKVTVLNYVAAQILDRRSKPGSAKK